MKIFVNPYKAGSKSAKALVEGLREAGVEAKLIRKVNSKYKHDEYNHVVINWGDSKCVNHICLLNSPVNVALASDKLKTFKALSDAEVRAVPSFFNKDDAVKFLAGKAGRVVYCRTKLQGSQGDGIVVAHTPDELVDAKLYTGGLTDVGRKEYRIHVFGDKVLHVQQKRRRNGYKENKDFSDEIRNLKGGWVFGIKDVDVLQETKNTAVWAVDALGLDFGAVDILETPNGKGWVLEVNTACGLEGTTVEKYVEAIKGVIELEAVQIEPIPWG